MSTPTTERLYALLPAVLRQWDATQEGEPLRALMAVFEEQLRLLEADTDATWEDAFIETCAEWVVPYIGEALGVRGLRSIEATGFSQRAYVANTLAYRRRKGTAAVVEQLARDLTGHDSRVVEYFQRTLTSAQLQRVREPGAARSSVGTVDLAQAGPLEDLDAPFGCPHHLAEVRHIARNPAAGATGRGPGADRGRWNLPNLGLHLWRIGSDSIVRAQARQIAGQTEWWRVHPHDLDMPLYSLAMAEDGITSLAGPEHVARALSRRALADEERGAAPARWLAPDAVVRVTLVRDDGTEQVFSTAGDLVLDGDGDGIPDTAQDLVDVGGGVLLPRLRIAHLEHRGDGTLPTRRPRHPDIVHLDPQNGRLVFHPDAVAEAPAAVLVDHVIGAAAQLGAGVWDRSDALAEQLDLDEVTAQWGVSVEEADGSQVFETLAEALQAWNAHVAAADDPAAQTGLVLVMDNRIHSTLLPPADGGTPVVIQLPVGARLYVVAADWPFDDDGGTPVRLPGRATPARLRPAVRGQLQVEGPPGTTDGQRAGGLWLSGLSLEDGVTVLPGGLERLVLQHCMVLPPPASPSGGITIDAGPQVEEADGSLSGGSNAGLVLTLYRSVSGPVLAGGLTLGATLDGSVLLADVDALDPVCLDLPGAEVSVTGSTLIGRSACHGLSADSSIFTRRVDVDRTQDGCLRFCFVPDGSKTPRRFRCQPDRSLDGVDDPVERSRILARVRPAFVSIDPARPELATLRLSVPDAIRRGGEGGNEMGAFHHLQHAWREDNFRAALRQYLRHGLEAGLIFES